MKNVVPSTGNLRVHASRPRLELLQVIINKFVENTEERDVIFSFLSKLAISVNPVSFRPNK